MNIKDISDLNEKWTREYGISFEHGDGTIEVHAGHLSDVRNWINNNLDCKILHFRFDFDEIKNHLDLEDMGRFFVFYNELGDEGLLNAYFYIYSDGIMFIEDKVEMFDLVMDIVEGMNNHDVLEYHKFLIDNLAFE